VFSGLLVVIAESFLKIWMTSQVGSLSNRKEEEEEEEK
jgi:hypothetical protein